MKKMCKILPILLSIAFHWASFALATELQDLASKVDEYINTFARMKLFSGSVLIAKDGQILTDKGYGMANYEHNVANGPETKFRIASLTKQFTAVAVMQLVEQGLCSLDEPLSKYLPDYPDGDRIMLFHLLTHTSGIPDHAEMPDFNFARRVYDTPVSKTMAAFMNKPLEFEPGEKFQYSNSGYILLGYIIEKLSGMSYGDYLAEHIFIPLGMENTGIDETQRVLEHRASGYALGGSEIINADFRIMANAFASGAIYSTVEDMYLWDRALYSEKLLTKASLEKMFTPYKRYYGLGWGIVNIFDKKCTCHNGETEGFQTNISRYIDNDVCIIILSNFEQTPIERMSFVLAAIVFGQEYSMPKEREIVRLQPSLLDEYVGSYEVKPNFNLVISREGSRMFCQATEQKKIQIHPESESDFFISEFEAQISFHRDNDGRVNELVLVQGGHSVAAKKME
jgi:CubicO group peptidase (beta-lactamase class C family)